MLCLRRYLQEQLQRSSLTKKIRKNDMKKLTCYAEYIKLQKEVREMLLHKQNYEYILGIEVDKEEKNDRSRNIEK